MKPNRTITIAITVVTAAIASSGAAAQTFSDTTFNPANYTLTTYQGATGVTTTFGQSTTAGNPSPSLQATYNRVGGADPVGELYVAINNSFVYNPQTSGAVGSINASLDRYFQPVVDGAPGVVGSYTLRIFAVQDGNQYQATYTFGPVNAPGGTWYTLSQSGIQASDFTLFDPANYAGTGTTTGLNYGGDAITFGFAMRAAGVTGSDAANSGTLLADNFSLALIPSVPEPASWAMMILGFGMVGAGLRRRSVRGRVALAA